MIRNVLTNEKEGISYLLDEIYERKLKNMGLPPGTKPAMYNRNVDTIVNIRGDYQAGREGILSQGDVPIATGSSQYNLKLIRNVGSTFNIKGYCEINGEEQLFIYSADLPETTKITFFGNNNGDIFRNGQKHELLYRKINIQEKTAKTLEEIGRVK